MLEENAKVTEIVVESYKGEVKPENLVKKTVIDEEKNREEL